MHAADLIRQYEDRDLLRLLTAGSVDDGKSTLIGRLLHDSHLVYEDHLQAVERASQRGGSAGGATDFSLLLDGLLAEREQGITIDVAYRYFATPRRKFIIADTPGHVQYTRNMATGASTAEIALILVDASAGVLDQTRRHSFIASLLGIRHLLLVVNKMDLVDWSEAVYESIRSEFLDFSARLDVGEVRTIPLSALRGDNVVHRSTNMPWYPGAPLLHTLETVHVASDRNLIDLRFPVQLALRPHRGFRGYAGTLASGRLRQGDEVLLLPSGRTSRVRSIVTFDGDRAEAVPPMAVTVTLDDELDLSRGDMLARPDNRPQVTATFDAMLVWMSEHPLIPGRAYRVKHTTREVNGQVAEVVYQVDVNTLRHRPTETLGLNEIGRVRLQLDAPLYCDPYTRNRATGAFILIDRVRNDTVAAGMVLARRADDPAETPTGRPGAEPRSAWVQARASRVRPGERAERLGHGAGTVWLTGLPCSGKTTLALALERQLFELGALAQVIDGDNLRLGLSRDLGFTPGERAENVRRAAAVAALLNDAGLISIVALVSPEDEARQAALERIGAQRCVLVHLDAPLDVCRGRDERGLYARAERGEILAFSGVSAPYEAPGEPTLRLATGDLDVQVCVERIVDVLRARGWLQAPNRDLR